ncbi:tyrosine-protein phosphatase [Gordonia sp. SL306]|uniref:tyrosine-protein phosphatase n=1 Tax=Gordonia sp. SL306 TaxID=2995145 RepID=UPI0022713662|nr:tyrosine-protein phosphatase [Gordonia sp. SL306]WAC53977.1 tyrosine-protein phosphatase [Gordonia sp. SL306]
MISPASDSDRQPTREGGNNPVLTTIRRRHPRRRCGRQHLPDVGRDRHAPTVHTGVVYRSNALNTLTDVDKQKLVALGVTDIVDVRSPNEVAASPDGLPPLRYIKQPIRDPDNDFYLTVNRIIGSGPAAQQQALGGAKAVRMMQDYYRWMITDAAARRQVGSTLRDIATGAPDQDAAPRRSASAVRIARRRELSVTRSCGPPLAYHFCNVF